MDRRLLTVLGMSVVLALVVAAIFYQVSSHASAKSPSSVMKDVLVAGRPPNNATSDITTTVLQNITVLSANQQMQPDNRGQPISATVVNVLVTPEQAEILTLAGNEGRIALVLRNAIDQKIEETKGHDTNGLYSGFKKAPPAQPVRSAMASKPIAAPPPPPPPPAPAVVPEQDIMIRGREKTVEVIGTKKQ